MIATFELENFVSFGRRAGYAQCAHYRFSSGRDKTQHLDPGEPRSNPFGQLKGIGFTRAEAPGGLDRSPNRLTHVRITVAEHQWPKALTEIDVFASVNGGHGSALRAAKEDGRATDSFERAHRAVHAARRDAQRPLEIFAREIVAD